MQSNTIHIQSKMVNVSTDTTIEQDSKPFFHKSIKIVVSIVLLLAGISTLVSYTLVLCQENALEKLHAKTLSTQMDNIEIKNDVEFSRSLYNVYGKSRAITYLHKPGKVIEVDMTANESELEISNDDSSSIDRIVAGY